MLRMFLIKNERRRSLAYLVEPDSALRKIRVIWRGEHKIVYLPNILEEGTLKNLIEAVKREFPGIPPENIWVGTDWINPWHETVYLEAASEDYLKSRKSGKNKTK